MSTTLRWAGAVFALALALMACQPTPDERCDQLDDILRARALQLPRFCEEDTDCQLVELRPGYTVAANSTPSDPETDDVRRRRQELCGPWEPDTVIYQAVCEESQCQARKIGTIDRPDAGDDAGEDTGPDVTPDTDDCSCATSEDCNFGEVCLNGCTCDSTCRDACLNLERCGQLNAQTGFGVDLDNCIELCIDRTGGTGAIPTCLRDAACDDTLGCL